jgi:DNA-binding response OmpR family regulator
VRTLLAEDETVLAKRIAVFLRRLGHTVRRAEDGKNSLRLLKERPYDVAIIDLALPKLDGVALIREIHHGNCRGRPAVIVITAFPAMLPVPDPQHRGVVCEFLKKPVTMSRLKEAVSYCEDLLAEREDRENGARICERLIAQREIKPEDGQIAVVNIDTQEMRLFDDEEKAMAYAKQHGGRRPYLRYFNTKLYTTLRRSSG